jgi:hypothetical protein
MERIFTIVPLLVAQYCFQFFAYESDKCGIGFPCTGSTSRTICHETVPYVVCVSPDVHALPDAVTLQTHHVTAGEPREPLRCEIFVSCVRE